MIMDLPIWFWILWAAVVLALTLWTLVGLWRQV